MSKIVHTVMQDMVQTSGGGTVAARTPGEGIYQVFLRLLQNVKNP